MMGPRISDGVTCGDGHVLNVLLIGSQPDYRLTITIIEVTFPFKAPRNQDCAIRSFIYLLVRLVRGVYHIMISLHHLIARIIP
jgi:hypothetical protein